MKFLRTLGSALLAAALMTPLISGCEKRIIKKQERPFMEYAEKNWRKLTPRQKADYYEMLERQKGRVKRQGEEIRD